MLQGPRAPANDELSGIIDFLDKNLRPESGWSISAEYPTAITMNNIHNMCIIKDNECVVSHAVMKPLIIKTPSVIFKVGTIGSVVTTDAYRNQGYSSQVLHNCLDLAKQQLCDIAILWTNLYDFYRKLGFELAGQEVCFVFDQNFEVPASTENLRFSEEKNVSPEALFRLYSQHTVCSVRSAEEIKKYLAIPNTRLYTAWNAQNQLMAFAVEGKGADLSGYLHEWGGGSTSLISLLRHIRKTKNSPVTMIVPAHSENLIKKLQPFATVQNLGYLGMIKILNFDQLAVKIKRAFRAEGFHQVVLEKQQDHYVIGVGSDLYTIDDESTMIQLLFGPARIAHIDLFKEDTKNVLSQILPLPLWIWGWDSI